MPIILPESVQRTDRPKSLNIVLCQKITSVNTCLSDVLSDLYWQKLLPHALFASLLAAETLRASSDSYSADASHMGSHLGVLYVPCYTLLQLHFRHS